MNLFLRATRWAPLLILTGCTSLGFMAINLPAREGKNYKLTTVTYDTTERLKLDIYTPSSGPEAVKPVIVFFYGGSWQSGAREDYRFIGDAFARRGYVVVIPDYRKYPQVRFPAFMEDAAKAVGWVAQNITAYGGRGEGLYIAGHSAGAHLGALLVADQSYLAAQKLDSDKLIAGFAGLAGPYDFTPDAPDMMAIFGPPARYPQMRVSRFISGHEAPMLLLHGDADDTVASSNHEKLAGQINDKGGKVTVKTYPGVGHIGIVSAFSWLGGHDEIPVDVYDFFREIESRRYFPLNKRL